MSFQHGPFLTLQSSKKTHNKPNVHIVFFFLMETLDLPVCIQIVIWPKYFLLRKYKSDQGVMKIILVWSKKILNTLKMLINDRNMHSTDIITV